jgi:transcriptional regulator with XRE-family HTH domain
MKEVAIIPNVHKDAPSAIVFFSPETPISRLGFSYRSFKALTKNGYNTVALLLSLDEEALGAIENLGRKSIKEIRIVQEQLQRQTKTAVNDRLENMSIPDCRFIYTRETIYPTDYIGVLDISLKAHNVLYNAGIFSAGKLFNLEKEAVYNLAKTTKKISEELLAFIVQEKSLVGKIFGDEDLIGYIQKNSEERYNYRMSILEESYSKIPQNRLDKHLSLFLQINSAEAIQYSVARLSPLLKKVNKVSEIKKIFPVVAKTSRTGDIVHIQKAISFNLIEALTKTFTPFFTDPRYENSLGILDQRANGFTLQDIAEKRNLTRARISQIEIKNTNKLITIIKDFPVNILAFICIETGSSDYISAGSVREYLDDFQYNSQLIYLLENENIYKEYQYNRQYDVFCSSGLDLDFSALDIKKPVKEWVLNEKEAATGKKIEDFLIARALTKCAYDDICKFTDSEVGYARVGKIIQLSNNIVEIEKGLYVHRSCIIDFDEAATKLLSILQNQFRQFHGYSSSHILFDTTCIDLAMFMNDNGIETEPQIYMLAKHLFFKEKYNSHHFYFTEGLHIWEKQTDFPLNSKGVLINHARSMDGIITREETEKYLENLKFSKNLIINNIHNISDSTFYFYTETAYVLSEYLQINASFISKMKKSLDRLFDDRDYIIPDDIDEDWFETLPKLPLGLSWNLLLLQEVIRYNEDIGYKLLFSDVEQSPYRLSGAFVRANSQATLVDIIYVYTYKNFGLPYRTSTDKYRILLRQAGFIHGSEWFTSMHKVFNDPRFAFSNENKNIMVRK